MRPIFAPADDRTVHGGRTAGAAPGFGEQGADVAGDAVHLGRVEPAEVGHEQREFRILGRRGRQLVARGLGRGGADLRGRQVEPLGEPGQRVRVRRTARVRVVGQMLHRRAGQLAAARDVGV
jgi:hypothetical protein